MKISRRRFAQIITAAAALPLAGAGGAHAAGGLVKGDDGLYKQDWFLDSFLNMKEDLEEAAGEGKHFAVIWEQNGCPYCRETHKVNFAKPEISEYIKNNFNVLQLDLWGPRKVTDFDGKETSEQKLARRWGVNFTPTVVFFAKTQSIEPGKSSRDLEVARMPGYFKPFHFLTMFEYVRTGSYDKMPFQRYLQARVGQLREAGREVKIW